MQERLGGDFGASHGVVHPSGLCPVYRGSRVEQDGGIRYAVKQPIGVDGRSGARGAPARQGTMAEPETQADLSTL